jgi:hypothetical protein
MNAQRFLSPSKGIHSIVMLLFVFSSFETGTIAKIPVRMGATAAGPDHVQTSQIEMQPSAGTKPGQSEPDGLTQTTLADIVCDPNGVDIGAYVATDPPTVGSVQAFENLSRRHACTVSWYQSWDASPSHQPSFPSAALNALLQHDGYDTYIIPQLTWDPWVQLNDISSGNYDLYLVRYANQMKAWGRTIRLRFAHEMIQDDSYCGGQAGCLEWYPWQDQPTAYVAAFRHVHDVFTAVGARNVEFVWCTNNFPSQMSVVQKYYPGSDYVDWLCMDGYNQGNKDGIPGWPDWQSFEDIFHNIYHTFVDNKTFYGDKPIMIGETASCEAGPHELSWQTKSAWITNMFQRLKSPEYADIKAFTWFNINKECDWRINSSPQSLSAFQTAISDRYFSSHPYWLITGRTGVAGTTLSYTGGIPKTITSLVDGGYSLRIWNGTITPTHACYTFSPASRSYSNLVANQAAQNYMPALRVGCTDLYVSIGGMDPWRFGLPSPSSTRASAPGVNGGPVKLTSTNAVPVLGAERVIYKVNGINTSYTEMMGLPGDQLDTIYWLPWYNNVDLDTQLRIANVSSFQATVTVTIGGVPQPSFNLGAGVSTRVSYPVNNGPVKIVSTQNIVATERVIYKVNNVNTSFTEMTALPNQQLDNTYWLPWYNNVDLDTQLRIANVSGSQATITVTIGGVPQPSFNLAAGASTRLSYALNNGPVKIQSTQDIVAAERVIYNVNNVNTSFTEMMALPNQQLDNTYWLPWYNNVDLDTQLRIANVSGSSATVTVTIGGVPRPSFNLATGASTRLSFASINNGPVKIVSTQNIVVAERVIYKVNTVNTSFSEMMGLPNSRLDTTYWFPWYNNVDLDTQLRFGVP